MFKNIITCLVLLVSCALLATDFSFMGKLLVEGNPDFESFLTEKSNQEAGQLYLKITSEFIRPNLPPIETVVNPDVNPELLLHFKQLPKTEFVDPIIDYQIYKIKFTPEINYLKWTILALVYMEDNFPLKQIKEFFIFYERIGFKLRTALIRDISEKEYLQALKNIDAISSVNEEKCYNDIIWQMIVYNQPISSEMMKNFLEYRQETSFVQAFTAFARQVASETKDWISQPTIDSLIFTKKIEKNERVIPWAPEENTFQVLFNQKGFTSEERLKEDENTIKGMPVEKVGYNIHFPQTERYLGIVVRIYGGLGPQVVDGDFLPHVLREEDAFLLNHGYVVITLNLLDRLYLDTVQHNMPLELFHEIHRSIHAFYDVIDTRPEELISESSAMNEDLKHKIGKLKELDKYIVGQSFGAFMSVIQVLKFPGTFKGAIAMYGILGDERAKTFNMFNAINQIEGLSDRVFILLNVEDSVVEAASGLLFYHQARKLQKDVSLHLAQCHAYKSIFWPKKILYRNHCFNPQDPQTLPMYGKILSFLRGESLDSDAEKQAQLLNMFDDKGKIRSEYIKTNHSKLWYYLKENLFLASDKDNRHAARELVDAVADEIRLEKKSGCLLQ